MKTEILLPLSVLFLLPFACSDQTDRAGSAAAPELQSGKQFFISNRGDTILAGVPIPVQGNEVHPDSVDEPKPVPLRGTPRVVPVHNNVIAAGRPKVVPVPSRLTVISPGKNGVPLPKTVLARGKTVPAIQLPSQPALPPQFNEKATCDIRYLAMEQGMSSAFIWDMLEDSRGHLWFGTGTGGISRYNGRDFVHYTTLEGLSNNTLREMMEDSQGNLWFATDGGGMSKYDGAQFTHYTREGGLMNNVAYSILEDSRGTLWFGTLSGLDKFDGHNFTHYTTAQGLCGNVVLAILEDRQGYLWLGTADGGVSRFDPTANGGLGSFTDFTVREGLSANQVRDIWEDEEGILWFATSGGVSRFDGAHFSHLTVNEGLSDNVVYSILEDRRGDLWFGTRHGVNRYERGVNGGTFTHFTVEEGLSHNWVLSILEDRQGNLWFGTRGGGVNRYDSRSFTHFTENNGLENTWIVSILEDQKGGLWFGSNGGGLSRYDGASFTHYTVEQGLNHNDVSSIQEDQQGNLWIGMYGPGGVDRFDGSTFTHYGREQGLVSPNIWAMLCDSRGMLWFGTWFDGVTRYDPRDDQNSFAHFTMKQGLGSNDVLGFLEDSHGNVWFGTRGGGLSRYDGTNLINFDTQEGLGTDGVITLMEDSQHYLWFGGEGLSRYDPEDDWNHFVTFTTKDGLNGNRISSILEDHNGDIWVTTQNGINILKPLDGRSTAGNSRHYEIYGFGAEDGLKKINFEVNSACFDHQNRLWWGSAAGLTMLDLNHFEISSDTPKVLLSTIEIEENFIDFRQLRDTVYRSGFRFGEALAATSDSIARFNNYPEKLVLPSQVSHLTFHFYAIDWAAPHKIKYSYMVEGVDDSWSTPKSEGKADYRNLSYGDYIFKVKAVGESKVWSEPFEYRFSILPPWWHTWWARMAYVLCCFSSVFGYVRWRTFALRKRQRELERTVTRRTAEVVAEKERSEELLLNILPAETAEELKKYGSAKAKNYQQVTVLFADFKDFTRHAERLTPERLVAQIDYCFKAFDRIMEQNKVEKIKTIGDAYMAAAGLPTPNTTNPVDAVHAALAIRDFIRQYQSEAEAQGEQAFQIRIGVHSGPVVAGIVGIRKFAYDIWGDTVNIAARMESSGEAGRVNISQSTYELLKDHPGFRFQGRGKVQAKNKGELEMYFVEPVA